MTADLITYRAFITQALEKKGVRREDLLAVGEKATSLIMSSRERSPFLMYLGINESLKEDWRASEHFPLHGAWHHAMVAGILLKSRQNQGHEVTDEQIREAMARGGMLQGGVCGFHGICGAATALGAALSVLGGATPLEAEQRSEVMIAVSDVNRRIAERGGKRCCPRATYTVIQAWSEAMGEVEEDLRGRCPFHDWNPDCLKEKCDFHPD